MEELEHWLIKSMDLFWPEEYGKVSVVLNGELRGDHDLRDYTRSQWPSYYADVCCRYPIGPKMQYNKGHMRMYLDMLHADSCIRSEYVVSSILIHCNCNYAEFVI